MSGHIYISDSNNLFMDDDGVDDETFLKNSRKSYEDLSNLEAQRQSFLERKKIIDNQTIQSTERSISILRDSEQIGIATAEELMRQREQLEKTDKRLDEINATLKFSQKHINGIKSVFGTLKNYLSGKNDPELPKTVPTSIPRQSDLESKIPEHDSFSSHPSTRLRNLDQDSNPQSSGSKNFNQVLDQNLDDMYGSIRRLKGLAEGLSMEIDSQNDLIGNITDKTERVDMTVDKQNKHMFHLLKK